MNVADEGKDRTTLAMPGNYDSLISQVAALGNPRTALVMQADGPYDIQAAQQDFPAIVFSGYNGESQGTALAQVLFGQQNPAGHLNFTWYANDSQLAAMDNYGLTPSQTGGLGRTYMYFTGTPTYPFGYGLSYSTFKYSHVDVGPATTPRTERSRRLRRHQHRRGGRDYGRAAVRRAPGRRDERRREEQLAGFQKTNAAAAGPDPARYVVCQGIQPQRVGRDEPEAGRGRRRLQVPRRHRRGRPVGSGTVTCRRGHAARAVGRRPAGPGGVPARPDIGPDRHQPVDRSRTRTRRWSRTTPAPATSSRRSTTTSPLPTCHVLTSRTPAATRGSPPSATPAWSPCARPARRRSSAGERRDRQRADRRAEPVHAARADDREARHDDYRDRDLTNTGTQAVRSLQFGLTAPTGWTITATTSGISAQSSLPASR